MPLVARGASFSTPAVGSGVGGAEPVGGDPAGVYGQEKAPTVVTINLGDDDGVWSTASVRRLIRRIDEEMGDGMTLRTT